MSSSHNAQNNPREQAAGSSSHDTNSPNHAPATFRFVCESEDGKLCLFEDVQGHYTVVRTARLA
ncbi:MAG: hypothetical protein J5804_04435 [Eggerthellaceae bacterium]|nr:hypothetical protein [Eggerthellaceae bacterium]